MFLSHRVATLTGSYIKKNKKKFAMFLYVICGINKCKWSA